MGSTMEIMTENVCAVIAWSDGTIERSPALPSRSAAERWVLERFAQQDALIEDGELDPDEAPGATYTIEPTSQLGFQL